MVLRKHELEVKLKDDLELVQSGVLRDDNPLDTTQPFADLLQACRHGNLKRTQELISEGVNLNGKDRFDYTPLILASLCGHYELVELLLESGALAERDTFQGERCIYNALNNKIRNLLLKYDYSKSTDPLQPWAAHITSLLQRNSPKTSDIVLQDSFETFEVHKFLLSCRAPYFQRKFTEASDASTWKLPPSIPAESFRIILRYLYLGELPRDVVDAHSRVTEEQVLTGVDKISKQLEIDNLWAQILSANDRRLARQRRQDEVNRAQEQIEAFFQQRVLRHKMVVDTHKAQDVKWPHGNSIFADCILQADEPQDTKSDAPPSDQRATAIPVGPGAGPRQDEETPKSRSVLFPVHKAMLIRSPYFETMFSGSFKEAQDSEHLHIIKMDCHPQVLEIIITFLYTEKVECPLEYGLDLLYAADMLFLDKVKTKAAVAISTLGSGDNTVLTDRTHSAAIQSGSGVNGSDGAVQAVEIEVEPINVYDVIHAAWDLHVQRLEEFAARYLAYRLEDYIDEKEFAELIQESASRLATREETDTIELLDDIRYYLSERFRLRFEDAGLDEMLDENGEISAEAAEALTGDKAAAPADGDVPAVTGDREAEYSAGVMRTLDGQEATDEFESDALNYQILLQKIDVMLENLKLDA